MIEIKDRGEHTEREHYREVKKYKDLNVALANHMQKLCDTVQHLLKPELQQRTDMLMRATYPAPAGNNTPCDKLVVVDKRSMH